MMATFVRVMFSHGLRAVAIALAFAAPAMAADPFPTRPVRFIVNTVPGGLVDVTTRFVAEKMRATLGQQVIVENRPGGDGLVGIRAVKAAPPDGYTLLATAGTIVIQLAVKQDPGYDLLKDFTGVGPMVRSPLIMVVGAGQPDKTLADFITRAKAKPGAMSYASAGVGTATHIGAAIFLQQSGLDLMHVPYKGNGAAMPDVMSGRVDMIFEAYGSGASKVKRGIFEGARRHVQDAASRLARGPDDRRAGSAQFQLLPVDRRFRAGGNAKGPGPAPLGGSA